MVILLDVDRFKAINDGHGHEAGDEVLVQVAQLLRHHLRRSDNIARYGGEEFPVLLADGDLAGGASWLKHCDWRFGRWTSRWPGASCCA